MQNENKPQLGVILAIEDDSEDVEILRLALAKANCPWEVFSVPFVRDAIKYIGRIGEYADERPIPAAESNRFGFILAGNERYGFFDLGAA